MLTVEERFTPGVSESAILSRVRDFVGGNFLYLQLPSMPADDDRLFGAESLPATYFTVMAKFIEEEFGAIVSPCEGTSENLGSLRAVARFVAAKQPFAVG